MKEEGAAKVEAEEVIIRQGAAPHPGRFLARPRKQAQRRAPRGNLFTLRSVGFSTALKLGRQ